MKIWTKENWSLLGVLFYCFVLAYFAPAGISRIGFLPLLYFAYRSKNNALWLIVLLVFIDNPGYFFQSGTRDAVGRTPIYPFFAGGVSFIDLLAFTLILKSLLVKNTIITYRRGLQFLVFVGLLTFGVSFAFTVTTASMFSFMRQVTLWVFIFSIPRLLADKEDWLMFFRLLFPFIFLIFADQIQVYITGQPLAGIFNPEIKIYHAMRQVHEDSEVVSRAISGAVSIFIIYSSALIVLLNGDLNRNFRSSYLYMVIFTAYIVVLLSATRGWFLSFTFMFAIASLMSGGKRMVGKIVPYFAVLVISFVVILNIFPLIGTQAANAWARISTLEMVAKGDLSAGGTVSRWTELAPELLDHIAKNPLGYGASAEAFEKGDEHAGIVNPMIPHGVVGYFVIILVVVSFMLQLFRHANNMRGDNPYKHSLFAALIILIGLTAIHLTSRQIFGLNVNLQFNFVTPVIFALGNWLIIEAYNTNQEQQKRRVSQELGGEA